MKMSLREMTFKGCQQKARMPMGIQGWQWTDILVFQVLEQLQFSVGALGENWSAEGLHDLLDGHILVRELVSGRTSSQESC